tara:strand:+ start:772 stop:2103 length:1332 start_codon:yes stop_codon:yes gene_type:complete
MARKLGSELSSGGLKELRSRLLFVFLGILVFRFGSYIPIPGLDPNRLSDLFNQHSSGLLGMFNMFSGGALSRMTIFALSIMPYISASIIIQMFSAVSPKLVALKKEGESGQRKITQYTRIGTLFLSLLQATVISKWLVSEHIAFLAGPSFYIQSIITLVTGTMFLMWLGEQMTERGIGNGISLIIFSGIVARFPSALASVGTQVHQGQMQPISLLVILFVVLAVTCIVVFVERAQRRIKINYAKRQQGRRLYSAQSSYLPFKINLSGVIPPIFAQSILMFITSIPSFLGLFKAGTSSWVSSIFLALSFGHPVYMMVFAVLVIFFSFFYTALMNNPKETAENLKKSGAYIQGVRPGEQTANYLDDVITRLTVVGSIYLALVALLPEFLIVAWHVPFYFGGTSLLIVVVVLMTFMESVQEHLMSHQYESLMRKSKSKGSRMGLVR